MIRKQLQRLLVCIGIGLTMSYPALVIAQETTGTFNLTQTIETALKANLSLKHPALWTGSEFKGFALKDRPNPVVPIFSRPYLFCKVAAMSGGIFLRYGLEKTVMTSLGAGFINHTPPG